MVTVAASRFLRASHPAALPAIVAISSTGASMGIDAGATRESPSRAMATGLATAYLARHIERGVGGVDVPRLDIFMRSSFDRFREEQPEAFEIADQRGIRPVETW